jgi:Ca-activated chloride channel family protein
MRELFGIAFAALHRIYWAPVFITAIILLIRHHKKTTSSLRFLVNKIHDKTLLQNFSFSKQTIKLFALCTALFFLFIALLQPQWEKKEKLISQEGRDLLVALDISRSMLAQDIKPNRLEFIKLKLKALLKKLEFERVGLILFSGSAFVQCPLTVDYATFLMFLDQVDTEQISSGTTSIESALQKAIDLYAQYPARKNKLILLVTDGEDFSLNLESAKARAKKENVKMLVLGAGTKQGAPIPKFDLYGKQIGHEKNKSGQIAISKLNEKLLREICSSIGGDYTRVTYDDSDLGRIVALINKFEKEKFGNKRLSDYEEKYPWFLGASFLLFLLEWVL